MFGIRRGMSADEIFLPIVPFTQNKKTYAKNLLIVFDNRTLM